MCGGWEYMGNLDLLLNFAKTETAIKKESKKNRERHISGGKTGM